MLCRKLDPLKALRRQLHENELFDFCHVVLGVCMVDRNSVPGGGLVIDVQVLSIQVVRDPDLAKLCRSGWTEVYLLIVFQMWTCQTT